MNPRHTGKTPEGRLLVISLITALGVCAAALVSLAVQLRLAGSPVKNIFLWGGLFNILILSLGLGALFFRLRALSGRLRELKALVRPLADRDMKALMGLPKPAAGGGKGAGELFTPEDAAALEESLWSLGRLFESLNDLAARSKALRKTVRGENQERDALHQHIGELINKITEQFFEIEESAKQALEPLEIIAAYVGSLGDAGGNQSRALEDAGARLAQAADLSLAVRARMKDSAGRAETLRDEIAAGEEQAQEVNDIVKTIAREVERISEMTAMINQISEQTNILSMNAAIESAHAGQAGAGFAVVADEIRKLAESTKENAGRIHEEVVSISGKTKAALAASESAFGTFSGISGKIGDLSRELREISSAVPESGAAGGEIDGAIKEVIRLNRRLREEGAGMTAHHQSFKAVLEHIRSLSDTTRAEIREIQSGTGELLENVRKSQSRVFESLDQAEKLNGLPQPEEDVFSDSREVAVKRPPHTVL
jgi:methyl-accepting chemotaxis protein